MPISHDERRAALAGLQSDLTSETKHRLASITDEQALENAINDIDAPPSTIEQLSDGVKRRRNRLNDSDLSAARWQESIANNAKLSDFQKDRVQNFVDFQLKADELSRDRFKKEIDSLPFTTSELEKVTNFLAVEDLRLIPLVACAFLDDTLTEMFKNYIPTSVPGGKKNILRYNGPIGNLSSRINIAYIFKMADLELLKDIDRLRTMRNRFAHNWSADLLDEFFSGRTTIDFTPIESFMAERKELYALSANLSLEEVFRFRVIWIVVRAAYEAPLIWIAREKRSITDPFEALYGKKHPRRLGIMANIALTSCLTVKKRKDPSASIDQY